MAQIFVPLAARKAFDGKILVAQDASSVGTVYAIPAARIDFTNTDGNAYSNVIDAGAYQHIKQIGLSLGSIRLRFLLMPDRFLGTFFNERFGVRTAGLLNPDLMDIIPNAGGAAIKLNGVYWTSVMIQGGFGTRGSDSAIMVEMSGIVLDSSNALARSAALTAPGTSGSAGAGASSFVEASFTDGQASPVLYDGIRSWALALSNSMDIQPAIKSSTNRLAAGCTPGPIMGSCTINQLVGATNVVPITGGVYPFQANLPTGDLSHTLTLDTSLSWDGKTRPLIPEGFNTIQANYTLFGLSTGATTTAAWPFIQSYA